MKINKNRKICKDLPYVQSYIIDENNNYLKKDEYHNIGFGMSSEQENSKYIPVLKFKDNKDKLPCDDSYLSVFVSPDTWVEN